jgi:hypothetical protein
MVGTRQQPVSDEAARQRRVAVRALVLLQVRLAVAVAPQNEALAEPHQRHRLFVDHCRRADAVPVVA